MSLTKAIRAAEALTDLLDIRDVGMRVILDIQGSLPMSSETTQAIQAVEIALQEELWCPVELRLGMGLNIPDWTVVEEKYRWVGRHAKAAGRCGQVATILKWHGPRALVRFSDGWTTLISKSYLEEVKDVIG